MKRQRSDPESIVELIDDVWKHIWHLRQQLLYQEEWKKMQENLGKKRIVFNGDRLIFFFNQYTPLRSLCAIVTAVNDIEWHGNQISSINVNLIAFSIDEISICSIMKNRRFDQSDFNNNFNNIKNTYTVEINPSLFPSGIRQLLSPSYFSSDETDDP